MSTFNVMPLNPDLISSHVVKHGESPNARFTAVFVYPDGTRTFDDKGWHAHPTDPTARITNEQYRTSK